MCGIIAYKGKQNGVDIVLEGLKTLEYRGYDSWGIAVPCEEILVVKQIGKVGEVEPSDLSELGAVCLSSGQEVLTAIGHSRWATHGGVTTFNAHPHLSNNQKIALVHNGIVENHLELKSKLREDGFSFASQTDSEVIVNLIEQYNRQHEFIEAVRLAFLELEGRNAVVVIDLESKRMVGVRCGSPLIVGLGEGEYFIASDVPAFLKHTRKVNYLDDNQMVIVDGSLNYRDALTGEAIERRTVTIEWDAQQAEKGEFEHFMIKEINEQRDTLRRALEQDTADIKKAAEMINNAKGVFFIGCGTAGVVGHIGEYLFNAISKKHTNFVVASEFNNYTSFLNEDSLVIIISQSGETADVLEAMEQAKAKGAKFLSVVNVRGSSIMRESDYTLLIKAGPEQAVASTKATTAQITLLALLAYATDGRLQEGRLRLVELAGQVNEMINPRYEKHIRELANQIQETGDIYIIGRGVNYPLAKECSIKLQEVSYIHGEGFAGGELKHGPLALISEGTPVIVLVANDGNEKAILSNAQEIKSRGGYIIGIGPENNEVFDYWLRVPNEDVLSPIVNLIPVQILAYHLGLLKGNNPDKPRNLAKSVTVK